MAMEWMKRAREENPLEGIEIKPEVIQKAMKPDLDAMSTKFGSDVDAKLAPIMEYIQQQKADREAAQAAAARARKQQTDEENAIDDTDYITDPQNAFKKLLKPMQDRNDAMAALLVRKEVLGEMEYYADPKFKQAVDALIDSQPMNLRSNSSVVMNAYKSVYFDKQQEIKDGTIKSRVSMTNFSGNGTGAHAGDSTEKKERVLSDTEKHYARKLGVSEAEWIKAEKELEYV
jgi:hypothetical protein